MRELCPGSGEQPDYLVPAFNGQVRGHCAVCKRLFDLDLDRVEDVTARPPDGARYQFEVTPVALPFHAPAPPE